MIKFDWLKIEQLKANFDDAAEKEIEAKGEEVTEDEVEDIRAKYMNQCNQLVRHIIHMGPKRLHRNEFLLSEGWRTGFTKPTLQKRTAARRKKNKAARLARRSQRIK